MDETASFRCSVAVVYDRGGRRPLFVFCLSLLRSSFFSENDVLVVGEGKRWREGKREITYLCVNEFVTRLDGFTRAC